MVVVSRNHIRVVGHAYGYGLHVVAGKVSVIQDVLVMNAIACVVKRPLTSGVDAGQEFVRRGPVRVDVPALRSADTRTFRVLTRRPVVRGPAHAEASVFHSAAVQQDRLRGRLRWAARICVPGDPKSLHPLAIRWPVAVSFANPLLGRAVPSDAEVASPCFSDDSGMGSDGFSNLPLIGVTQEVVKRIDIIST